MLPNEIRATLTIGAIFVARMLGIFMIFPVLALYVDHFPDASMTLVGVALGVYGLLQALLQLPMAAMSDKYGRKTIILAGLGLFALGSIVAAFATTLWAIVIGRAIQGAGAIGATLLATVADQTRANVRTRAMAVIGILIGSAFTLSVVVGPILDAQFGLRGLFLATAILALLGAVGVSLLSNKRPAHTANTISLAPRALLTAIATPNIWRLYLSVFILHAVLTMSFLLVPLKVQALLGLDKAHSWQFYVPILFLSLGLVAPFLRRADEESRQKMGMLMAIFALCVIVPLWLWVEHAIVFVVMGVLFFASFNYLEASLPARVSQLAPQDRRGIILGTYSSAQFLGLFVGGSLGGFCWAQWQQWGVILLCMSFLILWLLVLAPHYLTSHSMITEQNI